MVRARGGGPSPVTSRPAPPPKGVGIALVPARGGHSQDARNARRPCSAQGRQVVNVWGAPGCRRYDLRVPQHFALFLFGAGRTAWGCRIPRMSDEKAAPRAYRYDVWV